MKKAWIVAGVKLMLGLALLLVVLGARVMSVPGEGEPSGLAKLDRLQVELAAGPVADSGAGAETQASAPEPERVGASTPAAGDAARVVACRLPDGRSPFMSAGDCATRGGRASAR